MANVARFVALVMDVSPHLPGPQLWMPTSTPRTIQYAGNMSNELC
jgi:hypothetical protein